MRKKNKTATKEVPETINPLTDLNKVQEELDKLFNLIPELICIASVDGYFKKLNPAWETILGFTVEELMSKPFKEFIHPDDIEPTFTEVEKQLKGLQTINFTNRYLCKNGEYKLLNWVATPSPDKILLYAAARDITECKQVEEQLKNSELLLTASLESQKDTILLSIDRNYCYLYFNKAHSDTMKSAYNQDVKIGMNILDCITSESDRKVAKENYDRTLKGESHSNVRIYGDVGLDYYESFFNPVVNDNNEIIGVTALARNITERKLGMDALKYSEEKFHAFFENSMDATLLTNPNGKIYAGNKAACEMFNYTESEIISLGRTGIVDTADPRLQELLKERTEKGKVRGELTHIKKGGIKFESEISSAFIIDKNGDATTITIINDITERKLIENTYLARVRLLQFASNHTLDELLEETLNEVEKHTGSLIGFYHFIEEDEKIIYLKNWSTRTKKDFCRAEGKDLGYDIAKGGVWVDCILERCPVIHNDYSTLPHKKGMPEGHAELIRELVVPVIRDGKIRAILGVGNKPTDYTEKDTELVSILADLAWDIAERKQAEEALRESETKYRILFETSLIGISATDLDGHIIQANQAYAQMYGFDTAEQMLKEADDIKTRYAHPEERSEFIKILTEKGRIGPKEVEVVKRDGTKICVLVTAHAIKDINGKYLYTQAEHIDISEQKKLEQALKQSRKEMLELSLHIEEAREKERTKIAIDLHDDLGQKLTALIMDVAWMKKKLPFEIPDLIDKMSSMSDLLHETLIGIQKIAGGLRPSILDDLGLTSAIKWQIQKSGESTGLNFVLTIFPDELSLSSELSTMIFRIIQEAITNVIRHANATECILSLIVKRNNITISIKDNGVGISSQQINSPVSFGLIGIRERIRSQGGTFSIKGKQGIGTELQINIPLSN